MENAGTSEIELLYQCVKGNRDAFGQIVTHYQSLVCAITFSATGDKAVSEELAQETFINAWKSLSQLKDLSRFRAWLCSIARNVILNHLRDNKLDPVTGGVSMDSLENIPHDGSQPIDSAISKEQQAVVRDALLRIPDEYRQPLVLFYREEQSVKEVALQMDLSEDAVRTRLSRARLMLKNEVEMMIENAVRRSRPGKAFTAAVMAGIAGIGVGVSGAAAGVAVAGAGTGIGTGTAAGGSALLAGLGAKIITAAAVVIAVGAAVIVTYKHLATSNPAAHLPIAAEVQKQNKEPQITAEKAGRNLQAASSINDTSKETLTALQSVPAISISTDTNETKAKTGISGIVIDKSSSKPINGAEIIYGPYNKRHSVFSDTNGYFEAMDVKPGPRQQIYVIAKNYATRTYALDILKNKVYQDFKAELIPGSKAAGTVLDPNGKPVEGAEIETFQFTNHPVITGKDGRFEIDGLDPAVDRYGMTATHQNYPPVQVLFAPSAAGQTAFVDFILKPGITIYGQITNLRVEPVTGAIVGNTTSRSMWHHLEVKTDKDGKYTLKNLPAGELVVWAVANKYAPYVGRMSLDNTTSEVVNIRLADAHPLKGKVVDKSGNPVACVQVCISEYEGVSNIAESRDFAKSGADGTFIIQNGPSEGKMKLQAFGKSVNNVTADFEAGQQEEYVITIDRTGRLYGKVIDDKTGKAIEKFNVKMGLAGKGKMRSGLEATWFRQGYEFDSTEGFFDTGVSTVPVGAQYAVTVRADGFDPLTLDPVTVQQIAKKPNRTEFRLKAATIISGRVIDSNGNAIAGATIRWLSESNKFDKFEHWDPADMVTTDAKGEFKFSGIGSPTGGFYVTAQTFAPYLGLATELPRDGNSIRIVLERGAELYGRIIWVDGKGLAGARIVVFTFTEQIEKIFTSPWPNFTETITDANGNYDLADLPEGTFQVNFSSPENKFYADRYITLKHGQSLELNIGDEKGFTITGVVRQRQKPLEAVTVTVMQAGRLTKETRTDSKGKFIIKNVPEGNCIVIARDYKSANGLDDSKRVSVDGNTILDFTFGDALVSGKIPSQFMQYCQIADTNTAASRKSSNQVPRDHLRITAMRFNDKSNQDSGKMQSNLIYGGFGNVDANGDFEIKNLHAGRYYLTLSYVTFLDGDIRNQTSETLTISDVFELAESQNLENVKLNDARAELVIRVIDSETEQGIAGAWISVKNDLDAWFNTKKLMPKDRPYMVTDEQGNAHFPNLPKGRYIVWGQVTGYLTGQSNWLDLSETGSTEAVIRLEPGAFVRFELSSKLKEQITPGKIILLECRVTNVDTGQPTLKVTPGGEQNEYLVSLSLNDKQKGYNPTITIPAGRYQIEYQLKQYENESWGINRNDGQSPLISGTVDIEVTKHETKVITLTK